MKVDIIRKIAGVSAVLLISFCSIACGTTAESPDGSIPEGPYFEEEFSFTADPASMFPGSKIILGSDGYFELMIPNVGTDKGTYEINGNKLKVTGSAHQYFISKPDDGYLVTVKAGGGVVVIDFYQDFAGAEGSGAKADKAELSAMLAGIQETLRENAGLNVDWSDDNGIIYSNLPYGKKEINTYDLYIPEELRGEDEVGVILYIHGGSWSGGDKADEAPDCKRYAKEGYITASMNYTLSDSDTDNNIFTMVDEIQACVLELKENLRIRGFNATKMAIGGTSAGGHLAALYAYSRADVSALDVVLLISKVGPSDFHVDTWWGNTNDEATLQDAADFIGGLAGLPITADQLKNRDVDEVINSMSPVHYVNSNSCPSVLAYGAKDVFIAPSHYKKLTSALDETGVDYAFLLYPNSDHALAGDRDKTDELVRTVKEYLGKYFGY